MICLLRSFLFSRGAFSRDGIFFMMGCERARCTVPLRGNDICLVMSKMFFTFDSGENIGRFEDNGTGRDLSLQGRNRGRTTVRPYREERLCLLVITSTNSRFRGFLLETLHATSLRGWYLHCCIYVIVKQIFAGYGEYFIQCCGD